MTVDSSFLEKNYFTYKVGDFEVSMLVDKRLERDASILKDVDDALFKKYVPQGKYHTGMYSFLIKGAGKIVLIDTGYGERLLGSLAALGVKPEDVDTILITHMNQDHIGGLTANNKAVFPKAQIFLSGAERDYWASKENAAVLVPYKVRTFDAMPLGAQKLGVQKDELLPGITPLNAAGHTPGHTMYLISSAGRKLLIWGDLLHAIDIQVPRPDISATFDLDPDAASALRRGILEYCSRNNMPASGMHLLFPVNTFKKQGTGYQYTGATSLQ